MLSKLLFVILLFVFSSQVVFSQGEMEFKEESFDFGDIAEGTVASHEFEFRNTGNEMIVISNVQASCGCTTPFWTKEPVAPGGEGIIKASYNSQGRPGSFTKTVTITSNSKRSSRFLTIKGNVTAKALITPSSQANLESFILDFGKIFKGRRVEKSVQIKNTGDASLSIISLDSSCKCVSYKISNGEIPPGAYGTLSLTYTPKQIGTYNEPITILTNDKNTPELRVYLKAQIEEDASLNSVVKESKTSVPFN